MKNLKQLKKYVCNRCGVEDFIFTRKNKLYAARLLKTSERSILEYEEDVKSFKEDVVYRLKNNAITEPVFTYTGSKQTQSANSIHYYISRGWTEKEGHAFLEQHRKSHIGKESAKYDSKKRAWNPEYWLRFGLVGEEAKEMANEFQKKSLKYYTFRYGQAKGLEKFSKCKENRQKGFDRRRSTEIKNIMNLGALDYESAVEAYRQRRIVVSPRRVEYWTERGFDTKEAVKRVKQWQSEMSPRSIHYWINNGFTLEQAQVKVSEFQARNSIQSIMARYDCDVELAREIQQHFSKKVTETKREKNILPKEVEKLEFMMYDRAVRQATNRVYKHYKDEIDPHDLRGHQYHLDHKYPSILGFNNNVPVAIIACKHNLQILSAEQNRSKSAHPSIELQELISLYETADQNKL